jgi:hypothetical protein
MFGEMKRGMTVLKMRGSVHDKRIREFRIDHEGVHVGAPFRMSPESWLARRVTSRLASSSGYGRSSTSGWPQARRTCQPTSANAVAAENAGNPDGRRPPKAEHSPE